jgi:ankyrin repeat protein
VKTCLIYISFDIFGTGYFRDQKELKAFLNENPLLDYAAQQWGHHMRGNTESACQDEALAFLRKMQNVSCISQVLLLMPYHESFTEGFSGFSALHMVSFFGLQQTINIVLQDGAEVNLKDGFGRTPLSYAAENGFEAVVRLLVDRGDIHADSKDKNNQTPLSWAAENGHEAMVRLLVDRDDIQADSRDYFDRTPLSWAARNGHAAVVRLLVDRDDVQADSKNEFGMTPLSLAADSEHEAMVRLLVD